MSLRPKAEITKKEQDALSYEKSRYYADALNAVNWSRAYKWKVLLDDVPPPFDRFGTVGLPTIDVTDPIAFGNTFDLEQSISWMRVPKDRGRYEIVLSVFDDDNGTIEKFFEDWFNSIYDVTQGVEYVTRAAKAIDIYKLNSYGKTILSRNYYVYPYQPIRGYNKQNESGPRRYEITLVIVSNNLRENEDGTITHEGSDTVTNASPNTGVQFTVKAQNSQQ